MCAVGCIAQGALLHSWAVVSVARPASLTYCTKKCGSMQHATHNMNDGAERACAASSIYCSKRCGWCQGYSYIPPLHKPPRRAAMWRALSLRLRQQDCPTPAPVHNSASRTSFTDTYECPTNVLAAFVASRSSTTSCSIRATSSSTLWTVRPPHTAPLPTENLVCRCGAVERR